MKRFRRNKGFTLVELLIASAIFATIIAVAGAMMLSGFKSFIADTEMVNGQAAVRQVVLYVSKDLRKANDAGEVAYTTTSVTISPASGSVSVYSYNSGTNTVTLNGTTIAAGISAFLVTKSGNMVIVTISSNDGGGYSLSTSILLR